MKRQQEGLNIGCYGAKKARYENRRRKEAQRVVKGIEKRRRENRGKEKRRQRSKDPFVLFLLLPLFLIFIQSIFLFLSLTAALMGTKF